MHPLQNGSQAAVAPDPAQVGEAGFFVESGDDGQPSWPGPDWFNASIKEFQNALIDAGIAFTPGQFNHLTQLIQSASSSGEVGVQDIPPAVNSADADSGFGGFRYTVDGTTLNLFTS